MFWIFCKIFKNLKWFCEVSLIKYVLSELLFLKIENSYSEAKLKIFVKGVIIYLTFHSLKESISVGIVLYFYLILLTLCFIFVVIIQLLSELVVDNYPV